MAKILGKHVPLEPKNYLINGNFDFWQRIAGNQLTVTANAAYGPDRWKLIPSVSNSNASQIIRTAATNSSTSGATYDMNFGAWNQNKKCAVAQILENKDTMLLRNKIVTFSFTLKSTSASAARIELLSWTGTADSVTTMTNAVPYTDWTTYTLAANFSSVASSSITTSASYQKFALTATVPTTCNNLIVVIHYAEDGGQQYFVQQAMLQEGSVIGSFLPAGKTAQQELSMCQRFYEKSYALNTVPGTASTTTGEVIGIRSNGTVIFSTYFNTAKRVPPTTLTVYSPVTGASGQTRNLNSGTDQASSGQNASEFHFEISAAGAVSDGISAHWAVDAEL